jgi:hypothetical protein
MLKKARIPTDRSCFLLRKRLERLEMARKPNRQMLPKIIREPVKKSGGQCSRVIFPIEKTLDQVAYIRTTVRMETMLKYK